MSAQPGRAGTSYSDEASAVGAAPASVTLERTPLGNVFRQSAAEWRDLRFLRVLTHTLQPLFRHFHRRSASSNVRPLNPQAGHYFCSFQ
jgi:hypothetical protein